MIHGVEQVRVRIPRDRYQETRDFYGAILGLRELNRSPQNEGLWFALPDGRELFCEPAEDFRPNRRSAPSLAVQDLESLADILGRAGYRAVWDFNTPRPRFSCPDPFANRLEFVTEEKHR